MFHVIIDSQNSEGLILSDVYHLPPRDVPLSSPGGRGVNMTIVVEEFKF